jgi:hypothetical protein
MPPRNLLTFQVYQFITNDFETAWDGVANNPSPQAGRGNFLFMRQTMALLEWASMLCKGDASKGGLASLAAALAYIDRRYFTQLPGPCHPQRSLPLPTISRNKEGTSRELLSAIFDLARHGLAHQYQQILVLLEDAVEFGIALSGAEHGQTMAFLKQSRPERIVDGRPAQFHLSYRKTDSGIWLNISPGVMYLDIKRAIEISGLLSRTADFPYFERPGSYAYTAAALEEALKAGDHPEFTPEA